MTCRLQTIIKTNACILLIKSLEIDFSEISIKLKTISFKEIDLKMPFGK